MIWAQWLLLIGFCVQLVAILGLQGREVKSTCDGWNVVLWGLQAGLCFLAGAFSGIFGGS